MAVDKAWVLYWQYINLKLLVIFQNGIFLYDGIKIHKQALESQFDNIDTYTW